MSEDIARRLKRLLEELEKEAEQEKIRRENRERPKLVRFGLREHEARAWLEQEPDYDKPIIRRNFTGTRNRRRLDRTLVAQCFKESSWDGKEDSNDEKEEIRWKKQRWKRSK